MFFIGISRTINTIITNIYIKDKAFKVYIVSITGGDKMDFYCKRCGTKMKKYKNQTTRTDS